jgi:osmotically inducible protein OsmC
MSVSKASGNWTGSLKEGKGRMKPEHAEAIPFSLGSRFEGKQGSNPEELIGAALCGCFSMALASALAKEGYTVKSIETRADVSLGKDEVGFAITQIELHTEVDAPGADAVKFEHIARDTKASCPVAKALLGVTVTLDAKLLAS